VIDLVRSILETLFIPIAVGLVIWAVTQRTRDKAEIKKTLADAGKSVVEGKVAEETVEAAVQLADITTLKEGIAAMANAYREERESLTRELDRATKTAETCLTKHAELQREVEDMRADMQRYHREVLDMYRRDLYHAHALKILTEWINDNLPKLLEMRPDIPKPPIVDPLPPLHINPDEDVPARRWYDTEPAVDSRAQEL
jgi:hypothetical protein